MAHELYVNDRVPRAVVSRFRGGDGVRALARDFSTTEHSIQECIRWGMRRCRGQAPAMDLVDTKRER